MRACGESVLPGDANMLMFTLAEGLARESNLLVTLVAFHRELTSSTTIPAMDARGLDAAMRFDSCGIWIIGGVSLVKVLSMATELEMAGLHPAMLEVSQGRFKKYTRGYPRKSYLMPAESCEAYRRACEVPDDQLLKRLLSLWSCPAVIERSESKFSWQLDRKGQAGDFWQAFSYTPLTLPPNTTGESMVGTGA